MPGFNFDQNSATRIARAVKASEQRGASRQNQGSGNGEGAGRFWAKLTGEDPSNAGFYSWDKADFAATVIGAGNPAFSVTDFTAKEINLSSGLTPPTGGPDRYVELQFTGYNSDDKACYTFIAPLPVPTAQYQVISNASSDITRPNWVADFMRAS
jgi:hypothetical protein